MSADPLDDVLAVSNARAAFSGGFAAGGPWAITLWRPGWLKVNAVIRGSCLLVLEDGGEPLRLTAGDVVVSDGSKPYVLCSEPGLEPIGSGQVPLDPDTRMGRIGTGGDVVCVAGHVDLSGDRSGLLRSTLPELIHVRGDEPAAHALSWLIEQLVGEMAGSRVGAGFASDHIAQLIFVQVLRICLAEAGELPAGWLRALADEQLAPALRLMHEDPDRAWRLDELAHAVAMSRTGFALRFRQTVGVPPLTYLLNWRMNLAAQALRQDGMSVAALAHSVGYTSESAFSNAFKRVMGVAPRHYRDAAREPAQSIRS
jgi:AraC-like DNA-binding protein